MKLGRKWLDKQRNVKDGRVLLLAIQNNPLSLAVGFTKTKIKTTPNLIYSFVWTNREKNNNLASRFISCFLNLEISCCLSCTKMYDWDSRADTLHYLQTLHNCGYDLFSIISIKLHQMELVKSMFFCNFRGHGSDFKWLQRVCVWKVRAETSESSDPSTSY